MSEKYLDPLTGLTNFAYLCDNYHSFIKNDFQKANLIVIDFKNFKYINDNFGHDVGDKGLIIFSNCAQIIFSDSIIIRRSGDEFIILTNFSLKQIAKKIDLIHQKICDAVEDKKIPLPFSFNSGVKQVEEDFFETLFKAEVTMYQAKKTRKRLLAYNEKYYTEAKKQETYLMEIDSMIKKNSLIIQKQAIYNLDDIKRTMWELYIKDHKKHTIFKNKNIEALRKSFRVKRMELKILNQILANPDLQKHPLMINIDSQTLFGYEIDFVKYVKGLVKKNNLDASNIVFCIDVSHYEGKISVIIDVMKKLKIVGFKLAIQGVNFSDRMTIIPIISNVEIDYVKISIELVKKSMDLVRMNIIMKHMIRMLGDFKVIVIYANVSKREDVLLIKKINQTPLVKGYLFSKEEQI